MANYDLFIFRGHGNGDNGACANDYKEKELAQKLVDKVVNILKKNGLSVLTNNDSQNNYQNCLLKGHTIKHKFGYSIHLNAGGGTGTEIFVPLNEKYLTLDFNIAKGICGVTNWNNRGIKSRNYSTEQTSIRVDGTKSSGTDYYKEIREAWNLGLSLGILEVCFIDNVNDVKLFLSKIDGIANSIASNILNYLGIEIKEEKENILYKVQVGAFTNKSNAEKLKQELIKKGYSAIIKEEKS